MKQRLLLGALVLAPALAHAYPRNNEALAALPYLTVLLLATLVLLVLTFRQPHERSLQIAQGVCLLCFVGLRLVGERFFNILGQPILRGLDLILPLALLLNGLAQARLAQRATTCRLAAGMAVAGGMALCGLSLRLLLPPSLFPERGSGQAVQALLVSLAGWLLVLYLLRRQAVPAAILWQPGGRVLAAAVGACVLFLLFTLLGVWHSVLDYPSLWALVATHGLQTAIACWLTGVLAFRLVAPSVTS